MRRLPPALLPGTSPFVAFDEFWVSQRGPFGPHPHGGFSAVTVVLRDSAGAMHNRDSLGDNSVIVPGGIHWTLAGRGVIHEEEPATPGVVVHGLQLFIDLPDGARDEAPTSLRGDAAGVPDVSTGAGSSVRVVVGAHDGARAKVQPPHNPGLTILDVEIAESCGDGTLLTAPRDHTALLLAVRGDILVTGADASSSVLREGEVATLDPDGDVVAVSVAPGSGATSHAVLMTGLPTRPVESLHFAGPFPTYMADTEDRIRAYKLRYGRGEMGTLVASAPHA